MACIEKKHEQSSVNFLELRAKFGNGEGDEKNGGKDEAKSVAEKKKMFESHLQMFAADKPLPPLKPWREAPPPPIRRLPKENNSSFPLASSSSQINAPEKDESERTESVKNVIQKFNKIGPRLFGPDTPSADWMGAQRMGLGRLKEEGDEGERQMEGEVDSNSGGSDLEGYSELSDATTETGGPIGGISRRGSSLGKGDTLTTKIIEEMREKGLFKLPLEVGRIRNASKKPPRKGCASDPPRSMALEGMPGMSKSQTEPNDSPIPMRSKGNSASKGRRRTTAGGDEGKAKTASMASSQSGSTIDEMGGPNELHFQIPVYETGDEKEDKRLRELHSVALEFLQVQRAYVDLLTHIGENYLKYLLECERRMNRKWLVPSGQNSPHVIQQIADQFKMILSAHKIFLEDFAAKIAKWDSRKPDMAEVFQRKADFLKICNNFLKSKRKLAAEFQQALDENRELAYVTRKFEQGILNEGEEGRGGGNAMNLKGISIVMQLDAVHQNVVRYKLLMERYRKYLPDNLVEASIADEALRKLTAVSNTVNEFLAGADADHKLLELHRKLQGVFDVFAPGRKLLHEGELRRQTRKELQLRYLILFSDTLLLCRYSGTLGGGADSFDASSLYKMPIEKVRLQVEEHEDYEMEFVVQSPKKSSAFMAKSKRERDQWVQRISEAMRAAREKKSQRRSLAKMGTLDGHGILEEKWSTESNGKPINGGSQFYGQSNGHRKMEGQASCEEGEEEEESPEIEEKSFAEGGGEPTERTANKRESIAANPPLAPMSFGHQRRFEALWIPDNKATKCLMAGCDTRFSMLRRKHHCRQCGWLICHKCVGQAPVRMKEWARVKVCPQCFQENKNAFEQGTLFPPNMLIHISPHQEEDQKAAQNSTNLKYFSLDDPNLRIYYEKADRSVPPSELFVAPSNGLLAKARIPVKEKEPGEQPLASGKVYFRNRKGVPSLRWARLTREFLLQFYEAEFDDQAAESFFIYGYSVAFNETEDGGMVIELTHRNQIQTDRKEDQIVFHVLHSRSAEKWLGILQKILIIEEPLELEGEEEEEELRKRKCSNGE